MVRLGYATESPEDILRRRAQVHDWFGDDYLVIKRERVERLLGPEFCKGNGVAVLNRLIDEENKIRVPRGKPLMPFLPEHSYPLPEQLQPLPNRAKNVQEEPFTEYDVRLMNRFLELICKTCKKTEVRGITFRWNTIYETLKAEKFKVRTPGALKKKFRDIAGGSTSKQSMLPMIDKDEIPFIIRLCKRIGKSKKRKRRPKVRWVETWHKEMLVRLEVKAKKERERAARRRRKEQERAAAT